MYEAKITAANVIVVVYPLVAKTASMITQNVVMG